MSRPPPARQGQTLSDRAGLLLAEGPLAAIRWRDDVGWTVLECTPNISRTFGWTPDELIGRHWADLVHPDDLDDVTASWRTRPDEGEWFVQRYRVRCRDASWRWIEEHTHYGRRDFTGVGLLRDIDAEMLSARDAKFATERLMGLLDRSPLPTLVHEGGRVTLANRAFRAWFGEPGGDRSAVLGVVDDSPLGESIRRAADDAASHSSRGLTITTLHGHARSIRLETSTFEDRGRRVTQAVIVDITESRAAQSRLQHLAHHDPLTGLGNRAHLSQSLSEAVRDARGTGTRLAVLFVDLDRFKVINDSLGHDVGDEVLRVVAERLRSVSREGDTLARLGGDEFVVVADRLHDRTEALAVAARLLSIFEDPMHVAGHRLHVRGSVGVSVFPDDGRDATELMRGADAAMYRAKRRAGSTFEMFTRADSDAARSDLALEVLLHECAEIDAWEVWYQPIVRLADRRLVGAEALLRVPDGRGGYLDTRRSIAVAETSGLIADIGQAVMHRLCNAATRWDDAGVVLERVTVNVSPIEMVSPAWAAEFARWQGRCGANGAPIELELAESAMVRDMAPVTEVISGMSDTGVNIAIDDIGGGVTSLTSLRALPVSRLKLDLPAMRLAIGEHDAQALAGGVVALGRALGLPVVAEGIETEEDAALLLALGCHEAQGFLFGRPMPAEVFAQWAVRRARSDTG